MKFVEWWKRLSAAIDILFPKGIDAGKIWIAGSILALVMSWGSHKMVVLGLFHAVCSWVYVLYYVLSN